MMTTHVRRDSQFGGYWRRSSISFISLVLAIMSPAVLLWASQTPSSNPRARINETVPGVQAYTRLDAMTACGGLPTPEAFAELKRLGFRAVVNLRRPDEPNADIEAEGNTVRAAGLKYVNLPFNTGASDASSLVEPFLKLVGDTSNQPVFVHSVRAHRAVGLLLIKRVLVDKWSVDDALAEADRAALSDGSAGAGAARRFALDYIKTHLK